MRLRALIGIALAVFPAIALAQAAHDKVDRWVLDTAARGDTEFLVMLRAQADLRGARGLKTKAEKSAFVADALASTAARAQAPILALLDRRGAPHRAFWVADAIWVRGGLALMEEVAAREDVVHVYANPKVRLNLPPAPTSPAQPDTIEWNVSQVHAPDMWALGYNGAGIVVSGGDTGYQWDHPALKPHYRGWNGSTADHNYNWHDAIHDSSGNPCGNDSPFPCDDFGHGTHTMGTMAGSDGGVNQIGVAPGAKWIGCRNMDDGAGTPARYTECFQWFIAPTDLSGQNPDPTKAPDVINNSWTCPAAEGCTDPTILQAVVESVKAAGIEVVASAGNSGPSCSTVSDPPAIYAAAFSVGATDSSDNIADFSSRGPVTSDGSGRLKPDICGPGVNIRSSIPVNSYGVMDGTSMAGPHVVGVSALAMSALPDLVGNPDGIEALLTTTALARTTNESCGGVPGNQIPNNTYGWGRVDALETITADIAVSQTDAPDPTLVGVPVTYTITVTSLGPGTQPDVLVSEGLTLSATVNSATPSQGSCTLDTHGASCDLGAMASGDVATVTIVGTPTVVGTLTSNALATPKGPDPNPGNDSAQVQTSVTACPFPAPVITAAVSVPPATGSLSATSSSGPGHTDTWTLTGGSVDSGQGTNAISYTSGAPGTTIRFQLMDALAGCQVPAQDVLVSVDFLDVPPADPFHDFVNTVARNGVTAGCGGGNYCPGASVTRAQMAVFLLKSEHGSSYAPPACTGIFADVACPGGFAVDWIEQLSNEGITSGCGGSDYCPDSPVTRAQMAVFLLKALLGSAYTPPGATGIFGDVPVGSFAADWIEDLYHRHITGGCSASPLLYCPDNPNTRGQMAVFVTKTFSLQ
ncbi:MAG TPA: S8 family serine peptidase [Thermoanaerobaculia bacterium]|nr:S8 family serine peptidase [Thermoanaerobaculia bacterium]